ncbi:transglutaminase domain-containing protein [Actinoplanes sp. GCM10030250]|uniref:transglutaminase-like domain-containing protein n=1 Tax=Actinoplanes sp. GCM10030250 TaxID=3273376 RepID=UPI003605B934
MDYTRQTIYSDPRHHRQRLAALPDDPAGIAAVVRNLVVHYRASGLEFPPDRLAEIDSRWVDRMLDADASRFTEPLEAPRPAEQRIVGCCRDFTLLTVAALRAKGIPARSRVGFADYFEPGFHIDHVVTEYQDGNRWILLDSQLDPAGDPNLVAGSVAGFGSGAGSVAGSGRGPGLVPGSGLDVTDLPLGPGGFRSAAQSWLAFRCDGEDPETFGVAPGHPIRGSRMICGQLLTELAHRRGDELLLWDVWGLAADFSAELARRPPEEAWSDLPPWEPGELAVIDEIAEMLLAADSGDRAAESKLAARYAEDPGLHPGDVITCYSPRGVVSDVDLRRRSVSVDGGAP